MSDEKRKAGEMVAGAMRRIGYQHAVVTPAVRVDVVNIERVRAELVRCGEMIAQVTERLAQLRAHRTQLEQRIAEFDAAPIDRIEGDPDVPLEAPKREPAVERPSPAAPPGRS